MKKWLRCFFLGFFSHGAAKECTRRGYSSLVLSLILALVLLWGGSLGAYMLPFGVHYDGSPELAEAVHAVLANEDVDKRIVAEVADGSLRLARFGGEYTEELLINTLENDADKQNYSPLGFNIVVDSRPASTLAEVEAYCVSNDGKDTVISYTDYIGLSEVARLNFDFRLRYTGEALELSDKTVEGYVAYLEGLNAESAELCERAALELSEGRITRGEYNRTVYEHYFENYYPDITAYESTSSVPLLRNYYYHRYISEGIEDYLFIFDDYMAGSFKTSGGSVVSFYGFYGSLDNGTVIPEGATEEEAAAAADGFIKGSFAANWLLNAYACLTNTVTLAPFIALMVMVAALLTYSVLRMCGVMSIGSLGDTLKIVGSFVWPSGLVAAAISLACSFFADQGIISALPQVLLFLVLVLRSIVFAVKEKRLCPNPSDADEQTEA